RHEALTESAHPYVDLTGIDAKPVGGAKSSWPEHTQRMRFIDHQPGPIAAGDSDEGWQIGNIAVHAVVPLDDEERMPAARTRFAEQTIGGFEVEMRKGHPPRPGKHRALNDAVVDEGIVHDHVVAAEQVSDDRDVRG